MFIKSSLRGQKVYKSMNFVHDLATLVTRWGKFGRVFCKQTSVAACRFQNECNKVEIALRVVQFWSEIKLVITNRTPASRSCDFVITRLISDQIALHSVQLPLFNNYTMSSSRI